MGSGVTGGTRLAAAADVLARGEAAMRRPIEGVSLSGPGADDLREFYGLLCYHLGWADATFAPIDGTKGKRLRPLLLVRCAEACGGSVDAAVPAAAAIELLHNF